MSLLIDDYPLVVLPALAAEVGLNEALVLQQVHYWAERNSDGWVNQTIRRWREQFPFWSPSTIKRVMGRLRDRDLLLVEQGASDPFDRSNRYRVNYAAIGELERSVDGLKLTPSWSQIEPMSKETEQEETTSSEFAVGDDVVELWTFFVEVCRPANVRLTASRARILRRALNEAPLETCKAAVLGMKARGGKLDISRIFKTRPGGDALADQIEWWASQSPNGSGAAVTVPDWVKKNLRIEHDSPENSQAIAMGRDATDWLAQRGLEPAWSDSGLTIERTST